MCPDCSGPLTADPRWVQWCPLCDWNVAPGREPAPEGRRARWHERLVRGLHEEVKGVERPGAGWARTGGLAVAVLAHLLTLAVIAAGVWLVARWSPVPTLLGLAVLGLGWFMLPRPAKLPEGVQLSRAEAPRLYDLVDEVADALGAPRPHMIVIDGELNAAFGTYGLRRRRFLQLGYPLMMLLSGQERVALFGHELGHSVNGDVRHGLVVGTAWNGLAEAWAILRYVPDGEPGLVDWFAAFVMGVLRAPISGLLLLLDLLTHRATQRAEYRADTLSARVAGTKAALALADRGMTAMPYADGYLKRNAHLLRDTLWDSLESYVDSTPEIELERRRRAARLERLRVDETHPPSHLRHDHLAALPYCEPLVVAMFTEEVERELASVSGVLARTAADNARAALYA